MHLGQFEVQYLTGRWPPLPPEPQLGLTFSSQIPGSHIFWDWAYFQDDFSIKSKCQNSLCHSTSRSYFWSVDVTRNTEQFVWSPLWMTFLDQLMPSRAWVTHFCPCCYSSSWFSQCLFCSFLLFLGWVKPPVFWLMSHIVPSLYSGQSILPSLKLSCGSVQVCWPSQSHLFCCFIL